MAIQFLTGLNVQGNVNLNESQLQNFIVHPLAANPTGIAGRLYYNSSINALKLYNGTAWVAIDSDTKYDLTGVGSTNGSAGVRLTETGTSNHDDVLIVGAGTVGVTRNGNTLTVTGTDSAAGTVTDVAGGTGITITGTSTVTPTVNIDYAGTDNAILAATAATPVGGDTVWFSDADDNGIKKALISSMPGFGKDGTVTSVAATHAGNAFTASIGNTATIDPSVDITMNGASTDYINGLGNLTVFPAIPQGDITKVDVTAPITGGGATGDITIGHASQTDTETTDTATLSFGGTFDAYTDVTTNATGHVTGHEVTTFTLPANPNTNTTYQLGVGAGGTNSSKIELDASSGTDTSITLEGTSTTIKVTENTTTDVITLDFQNDVEIANDLFVGNELTVDSDTTLAGELAGSTATFTGQVTIPVTPTAAASAASKSYVDSTLAGSGALIFQGGYNAATNVPDLDSNPSASIKQGWTYAVTNGGQFFGETVEDGDLLIAETDAPTALSDWTVVQDNIGIATAGSTDGNTTKGIAGFNSAHFNVTSNGWVSSDIYGGGSTLGIVPSGGASTTFLRGDGSWVTPTDTNTQRSAGTGLSLSGNTINANVDGTQTVAANSSSSNTNRTYKIQVDSGDNLVVNVPWSDTNTQAVSSVDEISPGTSTGTPIVVNPTTGAVKV